MRGLAAVVAGLMLACTSCSSVVGPKLDEGFRNPPDSAKPWTWWHWVSGNVSKEGITRDLVAMKEIGLGGAQLFNVDQGPAGPVVFMSDQWRELTKHAIAEANRLGIELVMHNCEGWSEAGGPWITPELSMQKVVWSEERSTGPAAFDEALPQPEKVQNYYADIAVFAFPSLPGEQAAIAELKPKVTSSAGDVDGAKLFDHEIATKVTVAPTNDSAWVQLEFAQPLAASSFSIAPVNPNTQGELQVSDDGKSFRTIATFNANRRRRPQQTLAFEQVSTRFFRISMSKLPKGKSLEIADIELGGARMPDFRARTGMESRVLGDTSSNQKVAPDNLIARDKVLDLTSKMSADGRLKWEVPAGNWTILRFGHTSTGKMVAPAMQRSHGLEMDKMSTKAAEVHVEKGMLGTVFRDSPTLVGQSLKGVLIDSWEAGCQNWTPKFREDFQRLRGYDPMPWMCALSGRYVDSAEQTERFLWDYRRTIADLIAENHYGKLSQILARGNVYLTSEAVGIGMPTIADELQCKGRVAIPMGEFWVGAGQEDDPKEAASGAHIYGATIASAEAFTAVPEQAGWRNDPYSLKALGDKEYCLGINRFVFHRYAHQPDERVPGMTMGPWGINFERSNTWWKPGKAWIDYLTRCQYMLQRGKFVADLCYFYGEGAPVNYRPGALKPPPPPGYDFDVVNAEVIVQAMSVKDGRITLPGGMSYRALVLPEADRLTPAVAAKVHELVRAGATIVGPRPIASPSLVNYPACDEQVKRIGEEVWGDCDGAKVKEHAFGKGRIVWGRDLKDVLVGPDFTATSPGDESAFRFIHRTDGDAEIYFISSQSPRGRVAECAFRVAGRLPEIWHADTGRIEPAPIWRREKDQTIVTIPFDPSGSAFVVFRDSAPSDSIISITRQGKSLYEPLAPATQTGGPKVEITKAIYGVLDDPKRQKDVTQAVRDAYARGGVAAGNALAGDPAYLTPKQLRVDYTVDGKPASLTVAEGQPVPLPGAAGIIEPLPSAEVRASSLIAWAPGAYEVARAGGRKQTFNAPVPPAAIELAESWDVSFPPLKPQLPERVVTLKKLISWTDHPADDVKFYSGTATYVKTFNVPPDSVRKSRRFALDLGDVKNLAEVKLNGEHLGILWKAPFRMDVTHALKPGQNQLEVRITNLWPNRLIGDQNLPEKDRATWTAYNPYKKDSPLLPSGLLGPVMLRAAEVLPLE